MPNESQNLSETNPAKPPEPRDITKTIKSFSKALFWFGWDWFWGKFNLASVGDEVKEHSSRMRKRVAVFVTLIVIFSLGGCAGWYLHKKSNEELNTKLTESKDTVRQLRDFIAGHPTTMSPAELMGLHDQTNIFVVTNLVSFQLGLSSFVDKQTADRVETNLLEGNIIHITHNVEMARSPSIEGLSPGEIIELKKSKDISLLVTVYGNSPADHLTIELATPWVDQSNITGDAGWHDLGRGQFLDTSTKTFSISHGMALVISRLIPPNELIPLPKLHVPTNYPGEHLPIRFIIYSNNAKPQEVGVVFNLK